MCKITRASCPETGCTWTTHLFNPCLRFVNMYLDPLVRNGLIAHIRKGDADLDHKKLWTMDLPSCIRCTSYISDRDAQMEEMKCTLHEAEQQFAEKQREAEAKESMKQKTRKVKLSYKASDEIVRKKLRVEEWKLEDVRKKVVAGKGVAREDEKLTTARVPVNDTCTRCHTTSTNKYYFFKPGPEVIKQLMAQYEHPYVRYHKDEATGARRKLMEGATRPAKAGGVVCVWVDRSSLREAEGLCGACLRGEVDKEKEGVSVAEAKLGRASGSAVMKTKTTTETTMETTTKMLKPVDRKENAVGYGSVGVVSGFGYFNTTKPYSSPCKDKVDNTAKNNMASEIGTNNNINYDPTPNLPFCTLPPLSTLNPLKQRNANPNAPGTGTGTRNLTINSLMPGSYQAQAQAQVFQPGIVSNRSASLAAPAPASAEMYTSPYGPPAYGEPFHEDYGLRLVAFSPADSASVSTDPSGHSVRSLSYSGSASTSLSLTLCLELESDSEKRSISTTVTDSVADRDALLPNTEREQPEQTPFPTSIAPATAQPLAPTRPSSVGSNISMASMGSKATIDYDMEIERDLAESREREFLLLL